MFIISKSKGKKKKEIMKKYCRTCDESINEINSFCTKECEDEWKKNYKNNNFPELCIYENCYSGLPLLLGAHYCSIFCYTEQNIINKKKGQELLTRINQIQKDVENIIIKPLENITESEQEEYIDIIKNAEIAIRVEYAIEEVSKSIIKSPIYCGPVEQASNLLGSSK